MHSIHDHNQVQSHKDSMAVIKIERDSRLVRLRALKKTRVINEKDKERIEAPVKQN